AVREAVEDLRRCQDLDARCGELDRKRKTVEPFRDLTDDRVRFEAGRELPRALSEERRGVVELKRRNGILLLRRDVQPATTRREDACGETRDDLRDAGQEV